MSRRCSAIDEECGWIVEVSMTVMGGGSGVKLQPVGERSVQCDAVLHHGGSGG